MIEADSFHHAATIAAHSLFEIPFTIERLGLGAKPAGHDYVVHDRQEDTPLVINVARPRPPQKESHMSLTPNFSIYTRSDGGTTEGQEVTVRQYDNRRICIEYQDSDDLLNYQTIYLTAAATDLLLRGLNGEQFHYDCYPDKVEDEAS